MYYSFVPAGFHFTFLYSSTFAGTGKSAITNDFLVKLPRDKYVICNINFSARTTSNQTQDILFSKLDRYTSVGKHYCKISYQI